MPADASDLFARLRDLNIATTTVDHAPVFTVDEARALRGETAGGHCKNLFLKDKKARLWLIVCLEDAQINLKTLPAKIGSARISFGKPDLLLAVLGVEPGSVTPFGLINDTGLAVTVVLDEAMMAHEVLNYHPLNNTSTTSIRSADLLTFIRSCGHKPVIAALS